MKENEDMEKSAEAFRTISETAEIVDVPQHVLRFWETRFSQVRPMKRGGGRRLYRPNDIDLLLGLKRLLYQEGYTIKGVQKLLKENGVAFVNAVGSGDLLAAEEIANKKKKPQPSSIPTQNELFPEDILPESKKQNHKSGARKLFGFLKNDEEKETVKATKKSPTLVGNNAALLQEVLFELIECKRVLDRSRQT